MMKKSDKLDIVEERLKSVEHDINDVKESIEFAHGEIDGQQTHKVTTEETKQRLDKLERENIILNDSVIDLKARSMRDNLIFFNIQEIEKENTTNIIHKLLEEKRRWIWKMLKGKLKSTDHIGWLNDAKEQENRDQLSSNSIATRIKSSFVSTQENLKERGLESQSNIQKKLRKPGKVCIPRA